eukprot:4874086-Karenia_brevis.AAC.1
MVRSRKEKTPVPILERGKPLGASYVENWTLVAISAADAKAGLNSFCAVAEKNGLSLHPGLIG